MDIERMVVPIEWKATDDDHVMEGYASTFGNVDLGGDVVVRGAFAKTIAALKANGGIPLLADHVAMTASVLGTIFDAKETRTGGPTGQGGLWVKANISRAPSAEDTRTKMVEGHLNKMSIGYEAMDYAFEDHEDGQRVRLLKEVKLWESSVVVFPMNPAAVISRVKSILDSADVSTRQAVLDGIVETPAGDEPAAPATSGGEEDKADPPKSDAPDEGAQPPDEEPATGESGSHWDHWASEAVLRGQSPDAIIDPADRAGMATRLNLIDAELIAMSEAEETRSATDRLTRLRELETNLGMSG